MALTLMVLPALADAKSGEAGFRAVTSPTALQNGFDVHGDQLVWAHALGEKADLYLTNLSTGKGRLLTSIPATGPNARIQDLSFDGQWVVWADNRFRNLDLFAVDISTGALNRLTDHPADDREASLDQGRVVWSREGKLWMVDDVANPVPVKLPLGPGGAREPALWNDTVVWVRLDGSERYLMRAGLDGGNATTLWRVSGSFEHEPVALDGMLTWTSQVLVDPQKSDLGWAGHVVRFLRLPDGSAMNLTLPGQFAATTLAPSRVAWIEADSNGETSIKVHELPSGDAFTIPFHAHSLRASDGFLVAMGDAEGGIGTLYSRSWNAGDENRGIPFLGMPVILLGGLALAAVVRREPA